jgi:hypothetical protein
MIGYSILGDAGATRNAEQIKRVLINSTPQGKIALFHMNHPEKDTAEGIISTIPELRNEGFKFVKLTDYNLK